MTGLVRADLVYFWVEYDFYPISLLTDELKCFWFWFWDLILNYIYEVVSN